MNIDINKLKQKKSLNELIEFGIINIDKPSGPTSFQISELVGKILYKYGVKKTSHFGTLDPKVTGVLPVALNRACKLTGFFIGSDKEYVGIMRLHENIPLDKIKKAIEESFLGKIKQLPPLRSRVNRAEREREIKSFDILEQDENGKDFLFKTKVQGGTYIRKLIHDLGEKLGVGAHMLELRRNKAGIFDENESYTLYELEEFAKNEEKIKYLISPAEIVSEIYPAIEIKPEFVDRVLHGSPIYEKFLNKKQNFEIGKILSVFSGERFIGMFKVVNEGDIFAKSEFTLQDIK